MYVFSLRRLISKVRQARICYQIIPDDDSAVKGKMQGNSDF
jgi:hypothetical protein